MLNTILKLLNKGFDISGKLAKDKDTKSILVGVSAIFALAIGAVKAYQNFISFKRLFLLKSRRKNV